MREEIVNMFLRQKSEKSKPSAGISPLADSPTVVKGRFSAKKYHDKWLRAAAEVENTKKRMAREIDVARQEERDALLCSMLEILDNVERALMAGNGELNPWLDGFDAIRTQVLDILGKNGVAKMETDNQRFDPHRHQAIACVRLDHAESGVIVETEQCGFQFDDGRVLRPAKVLVSQ